MIQRSKHDLQLEHIFVIIAQDYELPLVPPGWRQPGDLQTPLPDMAERMLRYAVLVVICDKQGHDEESLRDALQECARLHGYLYDYLVAQLFSTVSGEPLAANYYEADDFLVLVMRGDVAPVIEVMGQVLMPFVIRHHRQFRPAYRQLLQLADQVLKELYADLQQPLRDGIIERIEPLLNMRLRPLPLVKPTGELPPLPPNSLPESQPPALADHRADPAVRESLPPVDPQDDDLLPDTGAGPTADAPGPAQQAANAPQRRTLRAPLPYWRDSDDADKK